MTPKAIPLGTNAFDAEYRTFARVDTESEKKSLQKQGQANGKVNSPGSQASQLDAVEQSIIQKIAQTAEQTRSALNQHFTEISERLMPAVRTQESKALKGTIEAIPNRMEGNLNNIFHTCEVESAIKRQAWQDAKKEYKDFRENNNLTQIPKYHVLKTSIFMLVLLIILEAALNSSLSWGLVGILTAFVQMFIITMVNVFFFAAWFGLCFRYKNHVSWKTRCLTSLCVPAILLVLAFNLGVGHYRDALVDAIAQEEQLSAPLDWDDANVAESVDIIIAYTTKAWESMKTSLFGIKDMFSWLLMVVGTGFFGVAAWKWYSMFDPYPGYQKRDEAQKHTHEDYKKLVETTRKKMTLEIDDANDRVADERTKVMNMRTQHTNLENIAETLVKRYTDWIVALGVTQNYLLAVYRDSNRQARSELAPDHFNKDTSIKNEFTEVMEFNLPELEDVDAVTTAVKDAEEEIKTAADTILGTFNNLANMQSGSDGPQSS